MLELFFSITRLPPHLEVLVVGFSHKDGAIQAIGPSHATPAVHPGVAHGEWHPLDSVLGWC